MMDQRLPGGPDAWPRRAAVIGCGTMGLGIVATLAVAGLQVRFVDASPEQTRQAYERVIQRVDRHVQAGLLPAAALARARTAEPAADLPAAVQDADIVFEAVFERLEVKEAILSACAGAVSEDTILTTNTSSLPIDELASVMDQPERFLGVHWFNPPEWIPGVEVIPSASTLPAVVDEVIAFLRTLGKQPAIVGSGPGFVANRLQFALLREALACVEEGLASPQAVDEVVRGTFGFRLALYGPFQIADMGGLDIFANIFGILEQELGEEFRAPERLREMVEAGRLGTKSGAGFYSYSPETLDRLLEERDRWYASLGRLLHELEESGIDSEPGVGKSIT